MKKIVIFGASGFIGFNLLLRLNKNKNNHILAVYKTKKRNFNNERISWIKLDLTKNSNKLKKIMLNADECYHCASFSEGSKTILNNPLKLLTQNYIINNVILNNLQESNIKKFIFFSCTIMYPNSKIPCTESMFSLKKCHKSYLQGAKVKIQVEQLCNYLSNFLKTKFIILRHSNIYGPFDKYDNDRSHIFAHLISNLSKKITSKKMLVLRGNGREKRDFLFIDDLLNAVEIITKKIKNNFEIINICYGKSFSIKYVSHLIKDLAKSNKDIYFKKKNNSIQIDILVSNKKLKKNFKWNIKNNLKLGILKSINWYRNKKNFN